MKGGHEGRKQWNGELWTKKKRNKERKTTKGGREGKMNESCRGQKKEGNTFSHTGENEISFRSLRSLYITHCTFLNK